MSEPVFNEALKKELNQGKYTSWAENLTEQQLLAVLWAVGEFAGRASEDDVGPEEGDKLAPGHMTWQINHPRQVAALQILIKSRHRRLNTLEEALEMIRNVRTFHPATATEPASYTVNLPRTTTPKPNRVVEKNEVLDHTPSSSMTPVLPKPTKRITKLEAQKIIRHLLSGTVKAMAPDDGSEVKDRLAAWQAKAALFIEKEGGLPVNDERTRRLLTYAACAAEDAFKTVSMFSDTFDVMADHEELRAKQERDWLDAVVGGKTKLGFDAWLSTT